MVSWISLKSKTYALQNILLTKWKDKPQTGRKYFQQISDKDLVTKIHKVFKLNNNATNKLNLKWANYLNRYLVKENMKPKFQLVLKQPLTGGHWNPPKKKKILHIQRQKRSYNEMVGGAQITIKWKPIPST